jgi:hypothetical protein
MVKVITNLAKDMSMAFTETTQNNNNLMQAFKDTKIVHDYLLNGFVIGEDWFCAYIYIILFFKDNWYLKVYNPNIENFFCLLR